MGICSGFGGLFIHLDLRRHSTLEMISNFLSDPRLVQAGGSKFRSMKDWWNAKLDEAIAAAEIDQQQRAEESSKRTRESAGNVHRSM